MSLACLQNGVPLAAALIAAGVLAVSPFAGSPKIIIAHRGASGYLPEHTLEAKALAYAMGADYLEQDVVLSKDDVPMVLHDICIDTVTDAARRFPDRKRPDGRYYAIDFTLAELKQLQATERFDQVTGKARFPHRFPIWQSSFQISTLEEELQLIQGLNKTTGKSIGIYPEIKAPAWHLKQGKDISRIVLGILNRYGYRSKSDPLFLQCFDFKEVRRIRKELGYQGRLVQLLSDNNSGESDTDYAYLRSRQGLEEVAAVADAVGPALHHIAGRTADGQLTISDLVRHAHELRLEVHPYTLRADALPAYAATMEELLKIFFVQADVDGVFTDHPDLGAAFLRARYGSR